LGLMPARHVERGAGGGAELFDDCRVVEKDKERWLEHGICGYTVAARASRVFGVRPRVKVEVFHPPRWLQNINSIASARASLEQQISVGHERCATPNSLQGEISTLAYEFAFAECTHVLAIVLSG
jgi:hypothetical protein